MQQQPPQRKTLAHELTPDDADTVEALCENSGWALLTLRASELLDGLRKALASDKVLHDPIDNARLHGTIAGIEKTLLIPRAFAGEIRDALKSRDEQAKAKQAEPRKYHTPRI